MVTTRTLFVSHSWRYSERYSSMIGLLNSRMYFSFKNSSVPESKAFVGMNNAQLAEQLRRQIAPAQCVIVVGGMWLNHSDWIQYEINESLRMRKPILGVRPRGAKRMPLAVSNAADMVVNWNTESIVAGIRQIS
jgi:hypothetical protein